MTDDKSALDRFLLRELIERYSYAVNARDWPTLADCFTEKGIWDVGPPFNFRPEGRAAVVKLISETVEQFDYVLQMPHASMIWVDGDRARAHTTLQELARAPEGKGGIQLLGTYADRMVREADSWRFEQRVFRPVNVQMEVPPGTFFK
jgi:ketosteroid isomerase-like protein